MEDVCENASETRVQSVAYVVEDAQNESKAGVGRGRGMISGDQLLD